MRGPRRGTVATKLIPVLALAFVTTPYVLVGGVPLSYAFAGGMALVALIELMLRPPAGLPRGLAPQLAVVSLVGFAAWSLAASLGGHGGLEAVPKSLAAGPALAVLYLILGSWMALRTPGDWAVEYAVRVVAGTAFLTAVLGIVAWFVGSETFLETGGYWAEYLPARVRVGFGSPNFLAGFLVVGVFSTLAISVRSRVGRLVRLLVVLTQLVCTALTFTRGAWLGVAVGFLYLGVHSRETRRAVVVGLILGAAALYGLLSTTELTSGAAQRVSATALRGAVEDRAITVISGLRVVGDYPLLGVGPAQYEAVVSQSVRYATTDFGANVKATNPHNSVLYAMSTTGIMGGLLLACLFGSVMWFVWSAVREGRIHPAVFALALGFVAQNMTNNLFFNPQIMVAVVLLCGATLASGTGNREAIR